MSALKPFFKKGCLINNEGYTPEFAEERISNNFCTAISFGKLAINNPNLVEKT